ncbi:hypothetical protein B7R70_06785 [Yersinia pseudotuberculosis]|uniref:hypothetical protein n=4 Tax=Yersinia pseudotuberculosis TaxID=633 RepID=UPI0005E6E85F|nr:hypothetical protein [Yersinia pseudotuberculosis]PSH25327.1 hypothetical protein BLA50_12720 [Yersinia pseudotuberculosis]PSH31899.1 hypothetical protein BLA51_06460 [Yersinia pseudotuberculosis]PST80262.1 hypothetical protein B7R70_06785 [Yersinia pseudotuberculosis]CNB81080.1 Uncharacterised protein [Yersinia pseudotuberculosis]
MDIIELLALVGKEGAELTINMNSGKGGLGWITDSGPILVAVATLIFSYFNAKITKDTQIKTAEMHAKTETKGKLRHEWLISVRGYCAEYMATALTLRNLYQEVNLEDIKNKEISNPEEAMCLLENAKIYLESRNNFLLKFYENYSLLYLYLDSDDYKPLQTKITVLYNIIREYKGDFVAFDSAHKDVLIESKETLRKEWEKIQESYKS